MKCYAPDAIVIVEGVVYAERSPGLGAETGDIEFGDDTDRLGALEVAREFRSESSYSPSPTP